MEKKKVGIVTEEERDEIQKLFRRHSGLVDLAKIVTADNAELYEKVVNDLGDTNTKFQDWWNKKGEKYNWESAENGRWQINFDNRNIYLVTEQ
jgi:CXXX repeat modification system protein